MKVSLTSILKYIVFVGLGVLIFNVLFTNFEAAYQEECAIKNIAPEDCSLLDKLIQDFSSAKHIWLVIILFLYMASNTLRALRWRQMLAPLGHHTSVVNTLGALMIGYFTNLAFPRVGEIIKSGTLSRYENIPFETVVGTVVVDRILDILSLLLVILLSFALSWATFRDYFTENFVTPFWLNGYVIGSLMLLGLAGIWLLNKFLYSKSDNPVINKIQKMISGFKDGLLSLKKVDNLPLLIFYTVSIWILYYLMTYLCFWSFTPIEHLGPLAGLVVFVFGTLGMVFPSPGGMGSYQALVTQGLIIYGINEVEAFSFSNIIFFTINVIGNILFGLIFCLVLPIYNSRRNANLGDNPDTDI